MSTSFLGGDVAKGRTTTPPPLPLTGPCAPSRWTQVPAVETSGGTQSLCLCFTRCPAADTYLEIQSARLQSKHQGGHDANK